MLSSWNMEFYSDHGEESKDEKKSKVNICPPPEAKQKKKLGSILNFETFERTNDDFYPQVLKDTEKFREFDLKQQVERKLRKSEELVKYMSCTPSYLERGRNPQEKHFNIGVLDWHLLEKWQHNNNGAASINRNHSQSTGNTASIISSKGSSYHCRSDNARTYHRQQMNHPSLPSNLNATVTEGCSNGTKQIAGNGQEFLDCKVQQSVLREKQSSSMDTMKRLIDSKSERSDLPKVTGMRSRAFETDDIISGLEGNGMINKGGVSKADKDVPGSAVTDCDFSERRKLAVQESSNNPESRHSAVGHQSESSKGDKNRSLEENQHTLCGGSGVSVCNAKSRSDYTHSYSVSHERGKTKDSRVEKSFSKEIRSRDRPSAGKEKSMPFSESVSISPSRRKNLEKKNSGSKAKKAENEELCQMKVDTTKSTKVRNPSPTRRISFGIGRIGKSSYSNATANLVSENIPDLEVTSTSACPNSSTSDQSNATSKARSSPLRRLLDPLLKPNGHDIARSSKRNPLKVDQTLKPSSKEPPYLHSVKGKLGLNSCGRVDICGPDDRQKNGTSSMQAILQVAVKNGLLLFTFTVDNCSDILAATVKEISCEKTKRRWVYTFFSFSEMKKKNAHWINQGSKDSNRGYISNIVGQMKASDIRCASKSSGREFVFSSVGAKDLDQTSDLSPGDELAAIIVKFPEGVGGQINHDGLQRGISDEQSKDPFPQVSNCPNLGNESANDGFLSTMVILPGGHHGVPSKGEPSPLIERWKSGGSCDCGGWDLGCRLRILANSNQSSQRFKSMKSQSTAFKLFSQEEVEVEVEEERPIFILSPFEDGIFSVEFDSSLKLVQAFSIGIAVLSTRTSAYLSSNMCGGKMFDEFTAAPEVSKIFNQVAPGEICAN